MNADKLYRENQEMIKRMSGKVSRILNVEREEIECQANLIFCECLNRYAENQGQFSKYLSNALYFGLYKFARHESEQSEYFPINENVGTFSDLDEEVQKKLSVEIDYSEIVSATLENLRPDCEYIKSIVFNSEIRMESGVYQSKRLTKRKIYKHLKEEGWRHTRIEAAFTEIKMALEA